MLWQAVRPNVQERPETLFDISQEFAILEEIKDVTDELRMLINIVDQQEDALQMLEKAQPDAMKHTRGSLNPSELLHRARCRNPMLDKLLGRATSTHEAGSETLEFSDRYPLIHGEDYPPA